MVLRSEGKERVSVVQTSEASWLLSTRSFQRGCVSQTISAPAKLSRKPETAGKVCTKSPRAPRRTTKTRRSGMRSLANGFKKVARGMIFWVADDGDLNAEARGRGALWHRFSCVVRAFGVNVGAQVFQQRLNTRFAEEHDVVD